MKAKMHHHILIASIICAIVGPLANAQSGEKVSLVPNVGHQDFIAFAAFTADNKHLISIDQSFNIKTWNVAIGQVVKTIRLSNVVDGPSGPSALSLDGLLYVGPLHILNVESGTAMATPCHNLPVSSLGVSTAQHLIACGTQDGDIELYKTGGQKLAGFTCGGADPGDIENPIVFSKNERFVGGVFTAQKTLKKRLCLYDRLRGLTRSVDLGVFPQVRLAFNANSDQVALCLGTNEVGSRSEVEVLSLSYSDALRARHIKSIESERCAMGFVGSTELLFGQNDGLYKWDLSSDQITLVENMASADITDIIVGGNQLIAFVNYVDSSDQLNILQLDKLKSFAQLGLRARYVEETALSPDAKRLGMISTKGASRYIDVWNLVSGVRESSLGYGDNGPRSIAVGSTSAFTALAGPSGVSLLVNGALTSLPEGGEASESVMLGANERVIVSISGNHARVWQKEDELGWKADGSVRLAEGITKVTAADLCGDSGLLALAGESSSNNFEMAVIDLLKSKKVVFDTHPAVGYVRVAFNPGCSELFVNSMSGDAGFYHISSACVGCFIKSDINARDILFVGPDLVAGFGIAGPDPNGAFRSDVMWWSPQSGKKIVAPTTLANSLAKVADAEFPMFIRDSRPLLAHAPGGDFIVIQKGGEVDFWDVGSGELIAQIENGSWPIISPDGRFDTDDLETDQGFAWIVADEPDRRLPLEIFMRDYYEPKLLPRLVGCRLTEQTPSEGCRKFRPIRPLGLLNRVQPLVGVRAEWKDEAAGIATVWVKVQVNRDASMGNGKTFTKPYDLRLFRDGQLVGWAPKTSVEWQLEPPPTGPKADELDLARWREKTEIRDLGPDGSKEFPFPVQVPRRADLKQVVFTAYAFNEDRVKSATASATLTVDKPLRPRKGKAYLVTVGVNRTESSPAWDLHYAANDARQMSKVVGDSLQGTQQFSDVVRIRLVSDTPEGHEADEGAPTKVHLQAVLDVLAGRRNVDEQLKREIPGIERATKAEPEDLVLLSFSSHGYTDSRGIFHIVLEDIGKTTPQDQITAALQRNSLSSDVLSAWLRDVDAGEMTMIVDACHSEATVAAEGFKPGPMGSRGLGQLAYDKGMRILAASKSNEEAMELGGTIKQGLLSYALVEEGLVERKAAKDGKIVMSGWLTYGEQEVPNLYSAGKVKGPNGKKPTAANGRDIIYLGPDQVPSTYQQPVLFDFAKTTADLVLSQ